MLSKQRTVIARNHWEFTVGTEKPEWSLDNLHGTVHFWGRDLHINYLARFVWYGMVLAQYGTLLVRYGSCMVQYTFCTERYSSCTVRYASCTVLFVSCMERYSSFLSCTCTFQGLYIPFSFSHDKNKSFLNEVPNDNENCEQ